MKEENIGVIGVHDPIAAVLRRWQSQLRMKAADYEHEARKRGEIITSPDIDDICNEIEAFLAGRDSAL